jgi:hypothetical protein
LKAEEIEPSTGDGAGVGVHSLKVSFKRTCSGLNGLSPAPLKLLQIFSKVNTLACASGYSNKKSSLSVMCYEPLSSILSTVLRMSLYVRILLSVV